MERKRIIITETERAFQFIFYNQIMGNSLINSLQEEPEEVFEIARSYALELEKMSGFKHIDQLRLIYGCFLWLTHYCNLKQRDFSNEYGISENSLSKWKKELCVVKAKNYIISHIVHSELWTVLINLVHAATTINKRTWFVNAKAIKLFLDYVEFWEIAGRSFRKKKDNEPLKVIWADQP